MDMEIQVIQEVLACKTVAGACGILRMGCDSAVAVASIPGGSLPLIIGLCIAVGVPGEGIALVPGFDRLLDMARTTLNVAGDVVTAVIVDEATGGRPEAR